MANRPLLVVEVCFITPGQQFLCSLQVSEGTTLQQVIQLSGLLTGLSESEFKKLKVGIYSKIKTLDTVLKNHDRVEIYRPLQVEPMVARRRKALHKSGL